MQQNISFPLHGLIFNCAVSIDIHEESFLAENMVMSFTTSETFGPEWFWRNLMGKALFCF